MPDTRPHPSVATPARHRRAARWLVRIVAACIMVLLVLAGLIFAAVKTEWGSRAAWQIATRALSGKLVGEYAGGTLSDGIRLRNVAYTAPDKRVRINRLEGQWHFFHSPLSLSIRFLDIGNVDVVPLPSPPTPLTLPQQLTLPLAIELERASIRQLVIHKDGAATALANIRLKASSDRMNHTLVLEHADTPYGTTQQTVHLNGKRPFPITGSARLDGAYQDERYQLKTQISGTLESLDVQLEMSGDKLNGQAHIEATPFAAVPLRRAQVSLSHLNPKLFNAAAPQADLTLHATLAPSPDTPQAFTKASTLTVAGPVSITNNQAGAVDKGLLPLISASAEVTLNAQRQQLARLHIRLPNDGLVEGAGELQKSGKQSSGQLALQISRLDLHALHTKLKPSRLDGAAMVTLADATQRIKAELTGPAFSVRAEAEAAPNRIRLLAAQLEAGASQLHASGSMDRDDKAAYTLEGKLVNFNPAAFLTTMQAAEPGGSNGKPVDAHINADFQAQGALRPDFSTQMHFAIHDSSYDKLPMTGGGSLQLANKRLLASDVQVSIAGNRLLAKGSFGAPADRLTLKIDAPALDRLGFGLAGLLQVDGVVGGTLSRPVIDATYRAERLALGTYRANQLAGSAHIQGIPEKNPDARVTLDLDAQGLQGGEIHLDTLHAAINGSYASHTIKLDAKGQLRGKPMNLMMAANGKLQQRPQGLAWDGIVQTLENRGVPRIAIDQPLSVSAAPGLLSLGATHITIDQALIDLKGFRYDDGRIRSEGAISALDVGRLLELQREFTGVAPPFKTDLVLDGRWNLPLADTVDGYFQIERRRGDIALFSGTRASTLGLNALKLQGNFKGNRVSLDAQIEAARIGSANAQAQLTLQQVDGHLLLTPDAPLSGRLSASIPRLQTVAALAGPRIALDGSLQAELAVSGTLGAPIFSGDLTGNRLALTLFDQGVRLRDGIARIHLDNNMVELREVVFHGGDGTLRATGRIPLDRSSPDLTADIVADRLQLLADPSMQLTLSGRAQAINVNGRPEVNGKFTVDHALISLPEKSAPKLDDDVHIIRGPRRTTPIADNSKPAAAPPAGPFTPNTKIEVNLGNDFRFKGSGADLLLAGAITIESGPNQPPQAFGTVRIVNGTYEAFGAKLAIERGIINFDGSFTNPNINITAMRRNQDVAAGVQVSGTALQPRVQLVSEPDVSEEEKLSWLVFGRSGGNDEAGQAQAAVKGAALGLLNKFGGARIAKGFGLDQLSIGGSEYGLNNRQVVNLGKEISDRLYIGYEQSLAGTGSVVKLTYEWTQHWSVVVRGGSIAGLELLYNRRFNNLFGKKAE